MSPCLKDSHAWKIKTIYNSLYIFIFQIYLHVKYLEYVLDIFSRECKVIFHDVVVENGKDSTNAIMALFDF